jgi:hypothetical protein
VRMEMKALCMVSVTELHPSPPASVLSRLCASGPQPGAFSTFLPLPPPCGSQIPPCILVRLKLSLGLLRVFASTLPPVAVGLYLSHGKRCFSPIHQPRPTCFASIPPRIN